MSQVCDPAGSRVALRAGGFQLQDPVSDPASSQDVLVARWWAFEWMVFGSTDAVQAMLLAVREDFGGERRSFPEGWPSDAPSSSLSSGCAARLRRGLGHCFAVLRRLGLGHCRRFDELQRLLRVHHRRRRGFVRQLLLSHLGHRLRER